MYLKYLTSHAPKGRPRGKFWPRPRPRIFDHSFTEAEAEDQNLNEAEAEEFRILWYI